ncbi:unnamed protein product [Peniophora sp. CBMAI 1063]|nr:unnamed protein product [Peniophora sp. CBMAI 1063]
MDTPSPAECFIFKLPYELWIRIIRVTCASESGYYIESAHCSIKAMKDLAHTCQFFRHIIMDGDGPGSYPNIMQDLPLLCEEKWVSVAAGTGTMPLVVRAELPDSYRQSNMRNLAHALSYISRIETLVLKGRDRFRINRYPRLYNKDAPQRALHTASVLTTLRFCDMDADSIFSNGGILPEIPTLETVQLRDCVVQMESPLFGSKQLAVLVLENVMIRTRADPRPRFVDMLRSCSPSLRELIVHETPGSHGLIGDRPFQFSGRKPDPSEIVYFPALEKISLRGATGTIAHIVTHMEMPSLRIAHVAPQPHFCLLLPDYILPVLCDSILRGKNTFDAVLLDQTRDKERMRVVAKSEKHVLELSLLARFAVAARRLTMGTHMPWGSFTLPWGSCNFSRILPDCILKTTRLDVLSEDCKTEANVQYRDCRLLMSEFSQVQTLALHGVVAVYLMRAFARGNDSSDVPRFPRCLKSVGVSSAGKEETDAGSLELVKQLKDMRGNNTAPLKLGKITVLYDAVLAKLVGGVPDKLVDDEMKEYMMRSLTAVREWEEFANSLSAKDTLREKEDRSVIDALLSAI